MTSEEFKALRKKLNLTQSQMAELLGRSEDWVKSIERKVRPLNPASIALIREKTTGVQSTLSQAKAVQSEFEKKKDQLKQTGFSAQLPSASEEQMLTLIMANNTTSSVTLELLCEVLSKVSGQNLKTVKVS